MTFKKFVKLLFRFIFLIPMTLLCHLPVLADSPIPAPVGQAAAGRLSAPPGFKISVYAADLGNPRGMAWSPEGTLYVCDMNAGRILRLINDGGGEAGDSQVVIEGLKHPHSLAFYQGYVYVGETNRVSRFKLGDHRLFEEDGKTILILPSGGGHSTRTVLFGPDGKLYVSIGSSCNACVEEDERRATICRCDSDGSHFEIFAQGLRNAVGMAFQPGTNKLFASCNGRDLIGDDIPPECLYEVQQGKHYGWPYSYSLHGKAFSDPEFGRGRLHQNGYSFFEYQAHAAPLGILFYTGGSFPDFYHHGLFICYHGSWNRSIPVGYKVVFLPLDQNNKPGIPQDFLRGFLQGAERVGRPVELAAGPKGELYISDDHGGRIFKVVYEEGTNATEKAKNVSQR